MTDANVSCQIVVLHNNDSDIPGVHTILGYSEFELADISQLQVTFGAHFNGTRVNPVVTLENYSNHAFHNSLRRQLLSI